jgi:hypothetical protein
LPIRLRRPARNKPKAPPIAEPTTQRHFSTASTHYRIVTIGYPNWRNGKDSIACFPRFFEDLDQNF